MENLYFPGNKVINLFQHVSPNQKVIPANAKGYVLEVKDNVVYVINWVLPDQFPGNEVTERKIGELDQAQ